VAPGVGLPREVERRGAAVLTSIIKPPADRRLKVSTLNFEGDRRSDLTVHGGVDEAVHADPSEHHRQAAPAGPATGPRAGGRSTARGRPGPG
jgi:MOSC domain-containing protein YiiM